MKFENQVLCMDVREALSSIPDEVVQTVVTSPPYWGLRDYGLEPVIFGGDNGCLHVWTSTDRREGAAGKQRWQHGKNDGAITRSQNPEGWEAIAQGRFCSLCSAWCGSLGLEPTPELYVQHLVEIFREVRRVLRKDGTVWLNLGDSYAGSGRGRDADGTWNPGQGGSKQETNVGSTTGRQVNSKSLSKGLIEKGALGNAWVKPPQGYKAKDRIGIPHMVVFALRADGWWWRDEIVWEKNNPMPESVRDRCTKSHEFVFMLSKSATYYYDQDAIREPLTESSIARLSQDLEHQAGSDRVPGKTNGPMKAVSHKGSVFHKGKTAIHQPNSSERPRFDHNGRNRRSVWTIATQPSSLPHFAQFPEKLVEPCVMAGSKPGDIVLDPFGGLGTVALVAKRHGRRYISIDLSQEYCDLATDRLRQEEMF